MTRTLLVVADIHYAGPSETARGWPEAEFARTLTSKAIVSAFRHFVWRRDPFAHNYLLDRFLDRVGSEDSVVALGDYSCDTGFVGVADPAAFESTELCLGLLRQGCRGRLDLVIGDHELGKMSVVGHCGGLRHESFVRAERELGLPPFWKREMGRYILIGITSSLVALPVYLVETLPEERNKWTAARDAHLEIIRRAFRNLAPEQKVIFFCHDPTALPFLHQEPEIRSKLAQIEVTLLGHLHSPLILRVGSRLAGIPELRFLGSGVRRMSAALRKARCWRAFHVRVCPALAGIQLLKDGGYLCLDLDPEGQRPLRSKFVPLPWRKPA